MKCFINLLKSEIVWREDLLISQIPVACEAAIHAIFVVDATDVIILTVQLKFVMFLSLIELQWNNILYIKQHSTKTLHMLVYNLKLFIYTFACVIKIFVDFNRHLTFTNAYGPFFFSVSLVCSHFAIYITPHLFKF